MGFMIGSSREKIATWNEKYRPRSLKDMFDREDIKTRLSVFIEKKSMPHLLFAGPPGTGKTTAALCFARDLYGDSISENFLELNASDDRGIGVIRNEIKSFASKLPVGDISFKIIYLDESDHMTGDAQHALRRTMERYSSVCRFILACNYLNKIIEPIQSRCALIRFPAYSVEIVKRRIRWICEKEGIEIDDKAVDAIVSLASGDLRKSENILQSTASLSDKITEEIVYRSMGISQPVSISKILDTAYRGEVDEAMKLMNEIMVKTGVATSEILKQIHSELYRMQIPEKDKLRLIEFLAEINYRLLSGADEQLQLDAFLARLCLYGAEK